MARPTLRSKLPKLAEESIGLLAALVGDVQSPLGPQGQQEEGKSEVQHGTHIDDQESSWSSPEQVRHWSGSGPVQVEQVEWQATHSADDVERYNPSSQPEQNPSLSWAEDEQEVQAAGPGPEQVAQEEWQPVQEGEPGTLCWPGGQEGRQEPEARE